jgi:hypothetical protein
MQITSQHSKAISERTGIGVKEGLFLDGVALDAADVSPWDVKCSPFIKTNFADSRLSVRDRATVTARVTADAITV